MCETRFSQIQSHITYKMELFSYKDRCSVRGLHTLIEAFKKELAWTTDKRLQMISNITLLKNSYTTKELCKE